MILSEFPFTPLVEAKMQLLEMDGSQLAGVEKHALSFLQLSLVTLSCKVMFTLTVKCNAENHIQ